MLRNRGAGEKKISQLKKFRSSTGIPDGSEKTVLNNKELIENVERQNVERQKDERQKVERQNVERRLWLNL